MISKFLRKFFWNKGKDADIVEAGEIDKKVIKVIKNEREVLSTLLSDGKEIRATWDAGGDQTCCNVSIDGDYEFKYKNWNLSDYLRERIIDVLNLPNASENYHKGEGVISLTEKGEIGMRFTSREHTYGDNIEEFIQWDMGDMPELKKNLHKVEVFFSGRVDWGDDRWMNSGVNTIYGEPIILNDQQKQVCEKKLNELLNKYEAQLGSVEDGQELSGVHVDGILGPDPLTSFRVDKSFEKTIYHKDEFVVLI
ncbi:hypothetical protein [Sporocytophaga myxococcoides]|uniref:hypothetical protein n=1 Tax=Sporocytophaga myxococcoides TaxID=153721 RepID=UPI000411D991|nr:hypothetical protein [Sporocytophaga myxococcoides]